MDHPAGSAPARLAGRPVAAIAAATALLLLAFSARYGYHRDELYFLACGRHLAWGYPDQPPLVPLLARAMSGLDAHSVVVLRLPADLAAATTVALTGLIAAELGAAASGQLAAAAFMAVSTITLATGHLLSTSTFDLTASAALLAIAVRVWRTGEQRWWLVAGVVAGIGLLDSDLVAFLAAAVGVGVLLAGPRRCLASPWLWAGVIIAAALWSPYLDWQATHGWPEFTVARAIAHGSSATSAPRWQIPLQQLYLASPPLVPVWIAGLVRLARSAPLRFARALAVAYIVLLVVFVVLGGKPYYLSAASFPFLLAAGAQPAVDWLTRHGGRRSWALPALLTVLIDAMICLPLLPVAVLHDTPILAVNSDAGETVAWPTYAAQLDRVIAGLPAAARSHSAVLTGNYGEAGALQHFGTPGGVAVYSRQDSYWLWGPPPPSATVVVSVGLDRATLGGLFTSVRQAGRLHNSVSLANQEQGMAIWVCTGLRRPWSTVWPSLRYYG